MVQNAVVVLPVIIMKLQWRCPALAAGHLCGRLLADQERAEEEGRGLREGGGCRWPGEERKGVKEVTLGCDLLGDAGL